MCRVCQLHRKAPDIASRYCFTRMNDLGVPVYKYPPDTGRNPDNGKNTRTASRPLNPVATVAVSPMPPEQTIRSRAKFFATAQKAGVTFAAGCPRLKSASPWTRLRRLRARPGEGTYGVVTGIIVFILFTDLLAPCCLKIACHHLRTRFRCPQSSAMCNPYLRPAALTWPSYPPSA